MRILAEVADRGSFAAAAQGVHLTPSAVSQHIAALEREVGIALVERGPRAVRLTPAGAALAAEAAAIVARLREVEAKVRALGGLHTGVLRLGAFASAAGLVVPALSILADRHPDLDMSFLEGDPEDCLPRLRSGELDLVVTYEYDFVPLAADDLLERVSLVQDPIMVALPEGHRLSSEPVVRLEDLRHARWIAEPRGDCHLFTVRACAAHGFDAQVDFASSDYRVSMELLAACGAVALVPELAAGSAPPGVALRPLAAPLARRIDATHRAGGERLPAVAAMIAALREAAARGSLALAA
jgi:DNA-binding transcriptional LysR family regulator